MTGIGRHVGWKVNVIIEGFKNEVLAQQLDRDMQVLTKLAGYLYVGLLTAVRPITPYICADFASPGYFMG